MKPLRSSSTCCRLFCLFTRLLYNKFLYLETIVMQVNNPGHLFMVHIYCIYSLLLISYYKNEVTRVFRCTLAIKVALIRIRRPNCKDTLYKTIKRKSQMWHKNHNWLNFYVYICITSSANILSIMLREDVASATMWTSNPFPIRSSAVCWMHTWVYTHKIRVHSEGLTNSYYYLLSNC